MKLDGNAVLMVLLVVRRALLTLVVVILAIVATIFQGLIALNVIYHFAVNVQALQYA
jgi:hypothetical protein